MASLTRPCALLHIVTLWAGAMTLSLGAEQKEKRIAGQAVAGPRAPTCLAALAAFLTASRGDFGVISETKRGGKDRILSFALSVAEKSGFVEQCSFPRRRT